MGRLGMAAQVFYGDGEVFGPGSSDGDFGAGDGMGDGELFQVRGGVGNQRALGLAGFETVSGLEGGKKQWRAAIDFVANNGKTKVLEMEADLMDALDQGTAFQQEAAGGGKSFANDEFGAGGFAAPFIHPHHAGLQGVGRNSGFGGKSAVRRRTARQRHINLPRQATAIS